jgi:transposase-like protein
MAVLTVPLSGGFYDTLPAPDVARWSPNRKEAIVRAVRRGALSVEEAGRRYDLSPDELNEWLRRYAAHGLAGLATSYKW